MLLMALSSCAVLLLKANDATQIKLSAYLDNLYHALKFILKLLNIVYILIAGAFIFKLLTFSTSKC